MKRFSFHSRSERLVAAARMTLAAFSFLAARLNVLEPGRYGRPATPLLNGYLWFAVVLFAPPMFVQRIPAWWPAATHAVELGVFLAFMLLTGGDQQPVLCLLHVFPCLRDAPLAVAWNALDGRRRDFRLPVDGSPRELGPA